jgi:hypothetical protein
MEEMTIQVSATLVFIQRAADHLQQGIWMKRDITKFLMQIQTRLKPTTSWASSPYAI